MNRGALANDVIFKYSWKADGEETNGIQVAKLEELNKKNTILIQLYFETFFIAVFLQFFPSLAKDGEISWSFKCTALH